MLIMDRRLIVKAMLAGLALTALTSPALAAPPAPPISISLGDRDGKAWPNRKGFVHTGGGNIDVQQPAPDTIVITLTSVAVAGQHPISSSLAQMGHEVTQQFEVSFDDPKVKRAKISIEGRVIGLLRSHKGGGLAAISSACGSITSGENALVSVCAPEHVVNNGVNLSINDVLGAQVASVAAGAFTLHGKLCISAKHPVSVLPCKAASAEFAPDPALDPLWISYWEPFKGAAKKDFGFQLTVKVSEDTGPAVPGKKTARVGK